MEDPAMSSKRELAQKQPQPQSPEQQIAGITFDIYIQGHDTWDPETGQRTNHLNKDDGDCLLVIESGQHIHGLLKLEHVNKTLMKRWMDIQPKPNNSSHNNATPQRPTIMIGTFRLESEYLNSEVFSLDRGGGTELFLENKWVPTAKMDLPMTLERIEARNADGLETMVFASSKEEKEEITPKTEQTFILWIPFIFKVPENLCETIVLSYTSMEYKGAQIIRSFNYKYQVIFSIISNNTPYTFETEMIHLNVIRSRPECWTRMRDYFQLHKKYDASNSNLFRHHVSASSSSSDLMRKSSTPSSLLKSNSRNAAKDAALDPSQDNNCFLKLDGSIYMEGDSIAARVQIGGDSLGATSTINVSIPFATISLVQAISQNVFHRHKMAVVNERHEAVVLSRDLHGLGMTGQYGNRCRVFAIRIPEMTPCSTMFKSGDHRISVEYFVEICLYTDKAQLPVVSSGSLSSALGLLRMGSNKIGRTNSVTSRSSSGVFQRVSSKGDYSLQGSISRSNSIIVDDSERLGSAFTGNYQLHAKMRVPVDIYPQPIRAVQSRPVHPPRSRRMTIMFADISQIAPIPHSYHPIQLVKAFNQQKSIAESAIAETRALDLCAVRVEETSAWNLISSGYVVCMFEFEGSHSHEIHFRCTDIQKLANKSIIFNEELPTVYPFQSASESNVTVQLRFYGIGITGNHQLIGECEHVILADCERTLVNLDLNLGGKKVATLSLRYEWT